MNAQDAMRKWITENAIRAGRITREEVNQEEKKAKQEEKENNPRWYKILLDYYDLADDLGFKVNKEFVQAISIEALAEVIEVLKEKRNDR